MATDSGNGSGVLLYQVPKMWEWFQNQAVGEDQKNFEDHDRESLNCLKQAVSSNMDFKDAVGEGSKGSKERAVGNQKKGNPLSRWQHYGQRPGSLGFESLL